MLSFAIFPQGSRGRREGARMVARVRTVAFQGIEAVPVDVQVMIAPGKVGMSMLRAINWR
jgi:hypothetical protein